MVKTNRTLLAILEEVIIVEVLALMSIVWYLQPDRRYMMLITSAMLQKGDGDYNGHEQDLKAYLERSLRAG